MSKAFIQSLSWPRTPWGGGPIRSGAKGWLTPPADGGEEESGAAPVAPYRSYPRSRPSEESYPSAMQEAWPSRISPPRTEPMALCRVVAFEGGEAECSVLLDGLELPRVGFPAWILKEKQLAVGARFIWIMRDASRIKPADIDTEIPGTNELTASEEAELQRLHESLEKRRQACGGEWPESKHHGD